MDGTGKQPRWPMVKLGDVCEILDYKRIPITKNLRKSGLVPYYGATGIVDHVDGYLFDEKLVLVGEDGAKWDAGCDTAFIIDGKSWVNNHAHVIRPNRAKLTDSWLVYYLNFRDLSEYVSGVTVPKLNQANLVNILLPLPPLAEQQRIVARLDAAFAAIDEASAAAASNARNARALFESYLDQVFSQRGAGWVERRLGEVGKIFDGPHATPKTVKEGPIFLGISALNNGELDLGETRHVTETDFKKWTKRVLPQANDFVFSYETRLGQAAIIPNDLLCCLGRRMGLIRFDPQLVNPHFFAYQYLSPLGKAYLSSKTIKGATVDRFSIKDFPDFIFSFPSMTLQNDIVHKIHQYRTQTNQLTAIYERKVAALAELKQSLLAEVFG